MLGAARARFISRLADFCTSDGAGKTPQRPSPAKNRNY